MRRLAAWMAVAVLGACAALPGTGAARAPEAVASASCAKETKRLKTFQRKMKASKRRFFRTHRGAKARKRFVRKQKRKLAQLRRARTRCRARPPAPAAPAPAPPAPPAPAPPAGGGLAPSPTPPPGPPARDVIENVISSAAEVAPAEIAAEDGVEFVRTQLELELAPDATAAEMDALLDRLDAEVVSSLDGVGLLTVRIPDPGSLAALRALAAGLAGAPGLAHADLVTIPVTTELPSTIGPGEVTPVLPQLASRAHAAWNARAGLTGGTAPTLVMADFFGNGPPGPEVAVAETAADFATGDAHTHGYTVLGTAAAAFAPNGAVDAAADMATGMWAGPDLPLRVVDLRRRIAGSTLHDRILQAVAAAAGDVVVNTSVADGCVNTGCTTAELERNARQWITRVRAGGFEGRFLHVSAAGNMVPGLPADTPAERASAVNYAALAPLAGIPRLTNTLVVENAVASDPADGPVRPLCLNRSSKLGGHLSAVGSDIYSLGAPGAVRTVVDGGTSNAAPQVSGTAATVWALAPALSPAQVADLLTATTRDALGTTGDARCSATPAAPALDAHAAVLAADSAASSPARTAILDADGSGAFDELDLEDFIGAFDAAAGAVDYGRFDLNGDGRTGGDGRDRVELDASTPPAWAFSRRREVLGLEIGHDENAVRDIDVLCHEAHGPLYEGDEAIRATFAEQHCLPPVELGVDPAFPASLAAGQSAQLRVVARRTDLPDDAVSQQPGVHITFRAVSGTVTPGSGPTGQDGALAATAALGGTGDLEVEVIARAGENGPELDRITVTAARGGGAVTFVEGESFIVANAESDADVDESAEASYTGSVSAADKDATGSATLSSAFGQSTDGFTITGVANISASDDGGGGDASAMMSRRFVVHRTLPFRLRATLQGQDAEETGGRISLGLTSSANPSFNRTTFGSDDFGGQLAPGDYTLTAEIGCSPGAAGGTCNGSFNLDLDAGAFVTP